jgi:hypothetical protein
MNQKAQSDRWLRVIPEFESLLRRSYGNVQRRRDPKLCFDWASFCQNIGISDETIARWKQHATDGIAQSIFPPRGLIGISTRYSIVQFDPKKMSESCLTREEWAEIGIDQLIKFVLDGSISPNVPVPSWLTKFTSDASFKAASYEPDFTSRYADNIVRIGDAPIPFRLLVSAEDLTRKRLKMNWTSDLFTPPFDYLELIRKWEFEAQERAQAKNPKSRPYFRCLGRLKDVRNHSDEIEFVLEKAHYFMFLATNLNDSCLDLQANQQIGKPFAIDQPLLANCVNSITTFLTSDNYTYAPVRSSFLLEGADCRQTSVGGFLDYGEDPITGAKREISEEWGIDECRGAKILFKHLGFGINLRTFEPDFLLLAQLNLSHAEVCDVFDQFAEKHEFTDVPAPWKVARKTLPQLVQEFRARRWSEPSDQASMYLSLCSMLGENTVRVAFQ